MDEKISLLTAPWLVKSLTLDENTGSVTVTVGIAENTYNHRKWLNFDTCLFITRCAVKPRPSERG